MTPLLRALGTQGVSIASAGGRLPVTVTGRGGLWGGEVVVDSTMSSQFVTALLVVAPLTREPMTIRVEGERGAAGYVDLTGRVMSRFGATIDNTITGYEVPNTGYRAADVLIEPDVSAAVYPMVAAAITGSRVVIEGVDLAADQPDMAVAGRLQEMGCVVEDRAEGLVVMGPPHALAAIATDMAAAPDAALALAVACLFADGPSRISGLGTLRHKESDRLIAISEGLEALGAKVSLDGDGLVIEPGPLSGAVIRAHGDHRVAMSLALAGLMVAGVEVDDPDVVTKTWPGYWEVMGTLVGAS